MLILGCIIYLMFRSKTLNIYQWCETLGLSDIVDYFRQMTALWVVPDFIRFSLPDGLYCAAYLLLMDAVWHDDKRLIKYVLLSIVPVVTIGSELLQYVGLVPGTFDIYDLLCYAGSPFVYIVIIMIRKK